MNEQEARAVVMVMAVETVDAEGKVLAPEQRQAAGAWVQASLPRPGRGLAARDWSERFLARRAERLQQEAMARVPRLRGLGEPSPWWRVASVAVPLAALLIGFFGHRIAEPQRVNLMSLPVLAVVAWNLLVYAALAMQAMRHLGVGARRPGGWSVLWRPLAWPARARAGAGGIAAAFATAWWRVSAPLVQARVASLMHLGAAALALGVVVAIYAVAWEHEYLVGWESHLLRTPEAVHRLLSWVYAPVTAGVPAFSVDELTRLHRWSATDLDVGERWMHLTAQLLAVVVVLPRLLLAAWAGWRVRRLRHRLPIDLTEPYYVKLLAAHSGVRPRLRVWPYAYGTAADDAPGWQSLGPAVLGLPCTLDWLPPTAYGAAPDASRLKERPPGADEVWTQVALFPMAATPENEAQGTFIETLRAAGAGDVVLVVERAAYARRLGAQSGERLREREALWREFGLQRHLRVVFFDLDERDDR